MNQQLSIVIPHKERISDLLETLTALDKQQCRDFEVIIGNSGAAPSALPAQFGFPLRVAGFDGAWNLGRARNIGAREAGSSRLFFLDCDISVEETFVSDCLRKIRKGHVWFPIVRNERSTYNADRDGLRVFGFGQCGIWSSDFRDLGQWAEFSEYGAEDDMMRFKAWACGLTVIRDRNTPLIHRDHEHALEWHGTGQGRAARLELEKSRWVAANKGRLRLTVRFELAIRALLGKNWGPR